MHRSRFAGLIIDCETDDLDAASEFWSKALGYELEKDPKDDKYTGLKVPHGDPCFEIQKVAHPSRVHLDIESDDIEAEVARLEALGARRLEAMGSWVVMEAPTGQRFCIVRPVRKGFEKHANNWGDE